MMNVKIKGDLKNRDKNAVYVNGKKVKYCQSVRFDLGVKEPPKLTIVTYPVFTEIIADADIYIEVGGRRFKVVEEIKNGNS